jgi:hypothetical protein
MIAAVDIACFFVFLGIVSLIDGTFVTMRQDNDRNGYFDIVDSVTGAVLQHSSEAPIVFGWPYCEMTSDQQGQRAFAVVFPDNSNNSVLYQLDHELHIQHIYPNTPFWFFDMQYSPKEDTLFGIKVTSTYGRVLSHFQLPVQDSDPLVATELVEMPFMWYVNASTFDDDNNRYFALLNYFPGHPDSTLSQKVVLAKVNGVVVPENSIVDIESGDHGILQFISYSKKMQQLYFASLSQDFTQVTIGVLCPKSGTVKKVLVKLAAYWVGPIAVDDKEGILTVFIKKVEGAAWTLYNVKLDHVAPARPVVTYSATFFNVFDAVARF